MMSDKHIADAHLRDHAAHFEKQIYRVADKIHVAVGFAASNVAMIEAENSLIIIDTTESTAAAEAILERFRAISDKPISTIIYTHSHRDHIGGASIFAAEGVKAIYASQNFNSDLVDAARTGTLPTASLMARTKAQFGIGLNPEQRVHLGLGPGDRPLKGLGQGFVPPTINFADAAQDLEIDGVKMHVFPAPGETPDHVNIWLDEIKLLFCGDNFYHAFPNLYAIRGTAYRDFDSWANTLDMLLEHKAEILVSGHGQPVIGAANISERLTDYRDAIRAVIEQAVKGMNAGLAFEVIAAEAQLPAYLAEKPWLVEHYGSFSYAVKACCVGLMGWYSGNVEELLIRQPAKQAADWLALIGGADAVMPAVNTAFETQNYALVLELCKIAQRADYQNDDMDKVRRATLIALAETTYNAPTRNSLFSAAMDLE